MHYIGQNKQCNNPCIMHYGFYCTHIYMIVASYKQNLSLLHSGISEQCWTILQGRLHASIHWKGYHHHLWVVSSPCLPPSLYRIASRMMWRPMMQGRAMKKMLKKHLTSCVQCVKTSTWPSAWLCVDMCIACSAFALCWNIQRHVPSATKEPPRTSSRRYISPRSDETEWLGGITQGFQLASSYDISYYFPLPLYNIYWTNLNE